MSVELIVPWLPGCPHREAAWQWLAPKYRYPVRLALGRDPWCKGKAVNRAVSESSADICVIADADVWTDGLPEAIAAVADGAPWAIPHAGVYRLSEEGTAAVLGGAPFDVQPLAQAAYKGISGGGYVITRRETLIDIPLDPRFTGWGQEDCSWAVALNTLAGPKWRGTAPLYHLYHPPQRRMSRRTGSMAGRALERRYMAALGNPALMRALVDEVKDARDADKPRLLDHSTQPVG